MPTAQAAGQTRWIGRGDGFTWTDGRNWEGGSAPGAADVAVIEELPDAPSFVSGVPSGTVVAGLSLGPSTGISGGDLTVAASFTSTGGTIKTPVELLPTAVGTISGSWPTTVEGVTLVNRGTMTLTDADVRLLYGAQINNLGSLTLGGGTMLRAGCCNPTQYLVNKGTLAVRPGATDPVSTLQGVALVDTGPIAFADGARLDLDTTPSRIDGSVRLTGSGRLRAGFYSALTLSGTVRMDSGVTLELVDWGRIKGTATVDGGTIAWNGGTFATGTVTTGSANRLVAGATGDHRLESAALILKGTTVLRKGNDIILGGDSASRLENQGSMTMETGSILRASCCGIADFALVNKGTLLAAQPAVATTGAVTLTGVQLRNTGKLTIRGTELASSQRDALQQGGTLTLDGGTLRNTGKLVVSGGEVNGNGTLAATVENGASVSPGTEAAPFGTLTVDRNYLQKPAGRLVVDVKYPSTRDRLAVKGTLTLGGKVSARVKGTHPATSARYDVLTYAAQVAADHTFDRIADIRRPTFRLDLQPTVGYVTATDLCAAPAPARTLSEAVDLLSCVEGRMLATTPVGSLSLDRQIYYGAKPWSRSKGFGSYFWTDVIPCTRDVGDLTVFVGPSLLSAVQKSQVTSGIDVGHTLAGLDAMVCPTPTVVMRLAGLPVTTVVMPNVEFASWGGDVASAVADWTTDTEKGAGRSWSFYFGTTGPAGPADLRGDSDAFAIRSTAGSCSAATVSTASVPTAVASTTLGGYYDARPSASAGARCLLATIGAHITNAKITDKAAVADRIAPRLRSAAELFYLAAHRKPAPGDLIEPASRQGALEFLDRMEAML